MSTQQLVERQESSSFMDQKYESAVEQYRDIMRLEKEGSSGGEVELNQSSENISDEIEQRKELDRILLLGYLNLALCYLKTNKPKECISQCDKALAIDSRNVKAHFRKGLAYLQNGDHESALKHFELVLEIDPGNPEAKLHRSTCHNALKSYYQQQKDVYKNLFARKS